jgi:hypothetical protein
VQRSVAIFSLSVLSGCASTQINYNTLDIASTYDELVTKQVTFNLRKTYEHSYGIPAFVKVSAQTATTQNSITPTLTLPLSDQIQRVAQITAASTGLTTLNSRTSQFAGKSLSLAGTDQWNQTYTLTPVIDPDQLRRLRALYQYVTRTAPLNGPHADEEFESTYPLIEATGSGQASKSSDMEFSVTVAGQPVTIKQSASGPDSKPKTKYVRRSALFDEKGNKIGYTWIPVTPDVTFIKQPGCILCDYGDTIGAVDIPGIQDYKANKDKYDGAHKLVKNVDLANNWLYGPTESPEPGAVPLPSNEVGTLYAKPGGLKYFFEFVLFTQEAMSQGTGSPTSGGQSEGRKTSPTQDISIPVGGITSVGQ